MHNRESAMAMAYIVLAELGLRHVLDLCLAFLEYFDGFHGYGLSLG